MRRRAALVVAGVLLWAGPASAQTSGGPFGGQGSPPAAPVPVASVVNAAASPGAPQGGPGGGPGVPGAPSVPDPYVYQVVPAIGPCGFTASGAVSQYVQLERRPRAGGPWEPVGPPYCTDDPAAPPPPVIDLDDIRGTAVSVVASVRPALPALVVQPEDGALVNQPAIFSVADPGPPPSASALNPLSQRTVTVTLAPPTYRWSFGDDAGRAVGSRRGQGYQQGDTVPAEGAGDPYVSHTYRGPGSRTVTVTASYAVSYTFSGDARVFTLPPLEVTDSAQLQVRAARTELVSR